MQTSDVRICDISTRPRLKLIRLEYSGGVVNIPSNMIPSWAEFVELYRDIRDAVAAAQDQADGRAALS